MMNIYASDDHFLVITDIIQAGMHRHLFIQISISLDRKFNTTIEGETFSTKGIIIDSNIEHNFYGRHGKQLFILIDPASSLASAFKRKYLTTESFSFIPEEIELKVKRMIDQTYEIKSCNYSNTLNELLNIFNVKHTERLLSDQRILDVIRLLKSDDGSKMTLDSLAKHVYLSKSRLSHLFKENTGIPLNSYVVLNKLQNAMSRIFNNEKITHAALNAGFDSPSHLAAVTKKLLGMSGSELRKDSVFLKVSPYLNHYDVK